LGDQLQDEKPLASGFFVSFYFARDQLPERLFFTASLTRRPSADLPARELCTAFITAPISFMDEAPVSAIAWRTAASISAPVAACGR
jgi:hypothetical protein